MERFIDQLSKQLATTTSRRSMLSITLRTMSAAIVTSTGIGRLWAQTSGLPGDVWSSSCGAVQQAVQLAFPDPTQYRHHGAYVSSVARSVSAAQNANLITNACSGCIVSQFAQSVPVGEQTACGLVVQPSQSCSSETTTAVQSETAAVLALSAAPNAWSDIQQFETFVSMVQAMLGCSLAGSGTSQLTSESSVSFTAKEVPIAPVAL